MSTVYSGQALMDIIADVCVGGSVPARLRKGQGAK